MSSTDHWKVNLLSRRSCLKTACLLAAGTCPLLADCFGQFDKDCKESFKEKKNRRFDKAYKESLDGGKKKKRSKATGFVYDKKYLLHTLGPGHPESPERLKAICRRLKATGLDKELKAIVPAGDPIPYIKSVHPESHIELVNKEAHDESICRLAVAGGLTGVDAVCKGKVDNVFCAIRPPGHHATNRGEYGFCFYNNVAVAARYAQQKYGLKKILIADWDYHHGNGTEWAFYEDPTVLFFSTHALYAFPGTGFANRTGKGKGKGFNINVPLPRGADDKAILNAFEKRLLPAAEKFRPELVLISAGFDSRKDDLLGDFAVTDKGFERLTRLMMSIAETHSRSRIVSFLEGGYNTRGLALAVEAHLTGFMNK